MSKSHNRFVSFISILFAVLFIAACAGPQPTPTLAPTATTAPTNTPAPTDTPVPTNTPEPTATFTAVPTDTPVPPTETPTLDLASTQAAESTAAVQSFLDGVNAELSALNISAQGGTLAWVGSDPITVTADAGSQTMYVPFAEGQSFKNFIWRADLTWESTGGLAGCGIMFYSEPNFEEGAQFRYYTIRLSGLPAWDIEYWKFGQWVNTLGGGYQTNRAINQENGATNTYIIVAKDGLYEVFANGTRLGRQASSVLKEGLFAFFTFQDSGKTTCQMSKSYIVTLP